MKKKEIETPYGVSTITLSIKPFLAGEKLEEGDLCYIGEDGKAYKTKPLVVTQDSEGNLICHTCNKSITPEQDLFLEESGCYHKGCKPK